MKKIFTLLVISASLVGCQDYLDVIPKGKFIPKTLQDFEELSANPSYASSGYALVERQSDGIYLSDAQINGSINTSNSKTYMWASDFYLNTENDNGWNPMYNNIYNANIILEHIPNFSSEPQDRVNVVKGDALCNRAFAYSNLILLYAPVYNAQTAAQDLGVPLLTVPDLEAKPSRATVKEVYDLILRDFQEAIPLLPLEGKNVYRNHQNGAKAMLARVYLQMGNYSEALRLANEVLQVKSTLVDYNTFSFVNPARPHGGITNKPKPEADPEAFAYRITNAGTALTGSCISPELLQLIDKKDLRFKFGWSNLEFSGTVTKEPYPVYLRSELNYNIGVPEMMLIAAECYARSGKTSEALTLLNNLRKKRFAPADYKPLTASAAEDALKLVINERRIELFGKGLRWLDMKRLDKDPLFAQSYKRVNTGGDYTLEKGSLKFVQQIPAKVLLMNPNMVPNPR